MASEFFYYYFNLWKKGNTSALFQSMSVTPPHGINFIKTFKNNGNDKFTARTLSVPGKGLLSSILMQTLANLPF